MSILKIRDNDNNMLYDIVTHDTTVEYIFYTKKAWGVTISIPKSEILIPYNDRANEILKSIILTLNNSQQ